MQWNNYGGIVKVSNSVRKYCDKKTYHDTDIMVDDWLQENKFRCVVVLLVDALGSSILQKYCKENSYLKKHLVENITTVFPPTTSAATTSLRTGKTPAENGWLGWNQYFEEEKANIILFFEKDQYTGIQYPDVIKRELPVTFLEDEMKEEGDSIWPSWSNHNPSKDYEDMWKNIMYLSSNKDKKYIYAYFDTLDTTMHRYGPSSLKVKEFVQHIEDITERYVAQLPNDVGVILLADHSQIDVFAEDLMDDRSLVECFRVKPALEPRTCAFYIKEEKKDFFQVKFKERYEEYFDLYSKEEVENNAFFGQGKPHARFQEFIGDYLAVAKSNLSLVYDRPDCKSTLHGDHAGGSDEEAMIPIILLKNNGK